MPIARGGYLISYCIFKKEIIIYSTLIIAENRTITPSHLNCIFHILFSVIIICAYGGDVRDVMLNAKDLGLLDGEYAFITIDLNTGKLEFERIS